MIKSVINTENKTFTFEFEGEQAITNYINSFVETSSIQILVNGLIENFTDEEQRDAYKCILKSNRHYETIIDAIYKMKNNEKVIYTAKFIDNTDLFEHSLYPYFNSLKLNQQN